MKKQLFLITLVLAFDLTLDVEQSKADEIRAVVASKLTVRSKTSLSARATSNNHIVACFHPKIRQKKLKIT